MVRDGVPDFTTIDDEKLADCVRFNKCGICGEGLGRHKYFIGGPKSAEHGHYVDPAMHEDCARYAMKACPFLAMGKAYSKRPLAEGCKEKPQVSDEAPDKFGLLHCTGYRMVKNGDEFCIEATDIIGVEWFTPQHTL